MARLGTIDLERDASGQSFATAVAFWLYTKAPSNHYYAPSDETWVAELQVGQDVLVLRSIVPLSPEQALEEGREFGERALDLWCLAWNEELTLKPIEGGYFLLTCEAGRKVLTLQREWPIKLHFGPLRGSAIGPDGKTVLQKRAPTKWVPALRYYRLSQTKDDIFDAYRYMFLAFEALLQGVCPIKKHEGERKWMHRAITRVTTKVDIKRYVPTSSADPINDFIAAQYGDIRLALFHAKESSSSQPHEGLKEDEIRQAYRMLTRFCRDVFQEFYGMSGQSGQFSKTAIQELIEASVKKYPHFICCEDEGPSDGGGDQDSLVGLRTHRFQEAKLEGAPSGKLTRFRAKLSLDDSQRAITVRRLAFVNDEKGGYWLTIDNGLLLEGIDEFCCSLVFYLHNLNMPRGLR